MADENVHKGHRKRMKAKFLLHGFDVLEEHEVLEMLLYYAVPRSDTNPIAHKLLDHFGSISAVFDASIDMLLDAGVSENTAVLLKMIPDLSRLYLDDKYNNPSKVIDLSKIVDYFACKFIGREDEAVMLLLTDAKGKEVYSGIVAKGSINSTDLPVRKIIDLALRYNAKLAIIAHNHPSGVAIPSKDDLSATKIIQNALAHVNVILADHVVIADDDGVSMTSSEFCNGIFYSFND